MLSRRNIRIKVMQVLYAMNQDQDLKFSGALKYYREGLKSSYELYLLNLKYFLSVIDYALEDAKAKASKLRPTDRDRAFLPILRTNKLSDSFYNNDELERFFRAYQTLERFKADNVRKLYTDFTKTEEHEAYITNKKPEKQDHVNILLSLYKMLSNSELFNEIMEDNFVGWVDDKSLVIGAMKKTIKGAPVKELFFKDYLPDTEATVDFGETLLQKVHEDDRRLLEIIEPSLKNWDAERVAIIDMILLKMAICELTQFPTIPTKVTLNEFVEISKLYSTDKSKDFINGILDRLMKKLESEGLINKEGRGLVS